ncbi:MAG: hypothetical protein WCE94_14465 [Candidatus Methanoperedens sp.]
MDTDEVLSIKQAAEALNVSVDTVRRRIKNNSLKAELLKGPRGNYYGIRASEIKVAKEVKDVVTLHHNYTPKELMNIFNEVLSERDAVMMQKIDEVAKEVKELNANLSLILKTRQTQPVDNDNVESPKPKRSIIDRILRRKAKLD